MSEMTREHLADIAEARDDALKEAAENREWISEFAEGSKSRAKYTHRAAASERRAARLAEVAAMIEAKLEEKV